MGAWGMSYAEAVSLTEAQINRLIPAYLERKKFEAKITLSIVGELFKPKEGQSSLAGLAAMGFGIRGM